MSQEVCKCAQRVQRVASLPQTRHATAASAGGCCCSRSIAESRCIQYCPDWCQAAAWCEGWSEQKKREKGKKWHFALLKRDKDGQFLCSLLDAAKSDRMSTNQALVTVNFSHSHLLLYPYSCTSKASTSDLVLRVKTKCYKTSQTAGAAI